MKKYQTYWKFYQNLINFFTKNIWFFTKNIWFFTKKIWFFYQTKKSFNWTLRENTSLQSSSRQTKQRHDNFIPP